MRLTLDDIVKATGGTLVAPGSRFPAPGFVTGVSTDSRTVKPGNLFVPLRGPHADGHDFIARAFAGGAAASLCARSVDGLPPGAVLIRVADPLRALGQIAAAYRATLSLAVIGVTGSVGKTSTTAMCAAVLGTRLVVSRTHEDWNAEIGVPLALLALRPEHQVAVIEMAMRGPGQIADLVAMARPQIGIVTTIGESHLEQMGSLDAVAQAKGELVAGLPATGVAILNADDPRVHALAGQSRARVLRYGFDRGADIRAEDVAFVASGMRFVLVRGAERAPVALPAWGRHNVRNALAAVAAGTALGLDLVTAGDGLARYEAPAMRLEPVQAGDLLIINDAYNASPASTQAALEVLHHVAGGRRRVAVLGEMRELGPTSRQMHHDVGRQAAAAVDLLVAVGGADAAGLAAGAGESMTPARVHHAANTQRAVDLLRQVLQPADVVLVKGSRAMEMERIVEALRHATKLRG